MLTVKSEVAAKAMVPLFANDQVCAVPSLFASSCCSFATVNLKFVDLSALSV